VVTLTHSEAIKAGTTVRTQLAPGLARIHGDRVQLQQLILNLIVNAIQAMKVDVPCWHDADVTRCALKLR
jgi:signal transduction histidine kinase